MIFLCRSVLHVTLVSVLLTWKTASFASEQFSRATDWTAGCVTSVAVQLADLKNADGILNNGDHCDNKRSPCDTKITVSVGSDYNGYDLLQGETETWENRNNLPLVFFDKSFNWNFTGTYDLYLRIKVDHANYFVNTKEKIAAFEYHVNQVTQLDPNSDWVRLQTQNGFVSLRLKLSILCTKSNNTGNCPSFCQMQSTTATPPEKLTNDMGAQGVGPINERPSTLASRMTFPSYIAYAVSAGVILAVLLALAVTLLLWKIRARSVNVIITSDDTESQTPHARPPVGENHAYNNGQGDTTATSSENGAHTAGNAAQEAKAAAAAVRRLPIQIDARKFCNPIYSSLMAHKYPHEHLRNCSTATQSSIATDATDLTAMDDDYEDLDAAFLPQSPPLQRPSPRISARRPLPTPGAFE